MKKLLLVLLTLFVFSCTDDPIDKKGGCYVVQPAIVMDNGVIFPNYISPDGDAINDHIDLSMFDIKEFTLYDNGVIAYGWNETKDSIFDGVDGRDSSKGLPEACYEIRLVDQSDKEYIGNLCINRVKQIAVNQNFCINDCSMLKMQDIMGGLHKSEVCDAGDATTCYVLRDVAVISNKSIPNILTPDEPTNNKIDFSEYPELKYYQINERTGEQPYRWNAETDSVNIFDGSGLESGCYQLLVTSLDNKSTKQEICILRNDKDICFANCGRMVSAEPITNSILDFHCN